MATNKNGHCELPYMEIGSLTACNGGLDQLWVSRSKEQRWSYYDLP